MSGLRERAEQLPGRGPQVLLGRADAFGDLLPRRGGDIGRGLRPSSVSSNIFFLPSVSTPVIKPSSTSS
jgi:hypothetical protein